MVHAEDITQHNLEEASAELIHNWGPVAMEAVSMLSEQVDWRSVGEMVEKALQSYDWSALPPLRNGAEQALIFLRQSPKGAPYAAWMEQRLNYIDMADAWLRYTAPDRYPSKNNDANRNARETVRRKGPGIKTWKLKVGKRAAPRAARRLLPELKRIFHAEGTPDELVWLAEVESSFNPVARSPVGAAGLFQFMPATAERFGLKTDRPDERLNPAKSARAAAQYLRLLYKRFKRWDLALAAYNAGEGRVGTVMKKTGASTFDGIAPSLPIETRMYVPKVLATISLREHIDPAAIPPPRK